tara:strand:+ start:302 stop:520 length:219 start_codon:yes stop_codon:yes gene_type:complete
LNNYWPRRNPPKGFSIERLSKEYRLKISRLSSSSSPVKLEQSEFNEKKSVLHLYQNNVHWANREFYEYFDVA